MYCVVCLLVYAQREVYDTNSDAEKGKTKIRTPFFDETCLGYITLTLFPASKKEKEKRTKSTNIPGLFEHTHNNTLEKEERLKKACLE